jgi:hypothetical protein
MSLRTDIHDALEEVTPLAPHLEATVSGLILHYPRDEKVVLHRGGGGRWTRSFRGAVTLVAAALVVVLIGGLILGGRVWRDLHTPPQPINRINQVQLRTLESRPLQFPVVLPGDPCPTSPTTDVSAHSGESFVFGAGPVYVTPLGSPAARTDWGTWTALGLVVDTNASGPILIRARDLETGVMVVFARYPLHAIDDPGDGIPTGRAIGTQVVEGETEQFYPELVIDTSRAYHYAVTNRSDWPIYKGYMGYPKSATGCLGFQVDGVLDDGTTFTELVVVSA